MKSKTILLIFTLVIGTVIMPAMTASSEILTFDDLPNPPPEPPVVPNGYGNLDWNGFDYVNGTNITSSGYDHAVVSPKNVAYNFGGNPAQISGALFDLNSAYLTAAWNNGLHVQVEGFLDSKLVYDHTYTVNTTGPTLITFDGAPVDEVTFTSSGGTPNPSYHGVGTQFAMDNLSVTLVPEPSIFALTGLGAVALLGFSRNRRIRRLA